MFYAKHRHANNPMFSDSVRHDLEMRRPSLHELPGIPDQIRVFPGMEPGHVLRGIYSKHAVMLWGVSQIKIFQEEIEKMYREGV